MSPYRLFLSLPIIHMENDDLELAKDFRHFIMTILKPNPADRPSIKNALNCPFLLLRDRKGSIIVYKSMQVLKNLNFLVI